MAKHLKTTTLAVGLTIGVSATAASVTLTFDDLSDLHKFDSSAAPYCVADSDNKNRCVTIFGLVFDPQVSDWNNANDTPTNKQELSIFGKTVFAATNFKFSGISFDYFSVLDPGITDAFDTNFGPYSSQSGSWDSVGSSTKPVALREGQRITFNGNTVLDNITFYNVVDADITVPESSSVSLVLLALGCATVGTYRRAKH